MDPEKLQAILEWGDFIEQSIPSCVKDRMEKHSKRKWEIVYKEPFGRCIVAANDLKEGEILFTDHPVVTGPKQASVPICLGCYAELDPEEYYSCSKCKWPMCSPECEEVGYHPVECKVFKKSGYFPTAEDLQKEEQTIYEALTPLRCLLMREHDPAKWRAMIALEAHNDLREGCELWKREQKNVVNFIIKTLKVDTDEEIIHTLAGILDVNCHEVRSNIPGLDVVYRVRGLYPLCAMMSHDCSSNTHHTVQEDMVMVMLASRAIRKGEMITCSYTHLLSGTTERRKHLRYSKFFDCLCDRCQDPTEGGSHFSSLLCTMKGCGGVVTSENPVHSENNPDYICMKCKYRIKSGYVNGLHNTVHREIAAADTTNPLDLEKIYNKYKKIFHPHHYHLISIKHSLSEIYGKVDQFMINEMSQDALQRKIKCCEDLLEVIDIIDPGISRIRGLTKYELHAPILINANKSFQLKQLTKTEFLSRLNKSLSLLNDTVYNLDFEPLSSNEGQICQIAKASSQELLQWINTVKTIPSEHFLPEKKEKKTKQTKVKEDLSLEALMEKVASW